MSVGFAKLRKGQGKFVAAEAEGDNPFVAKIGSDASDFHGGSGAELAYRVENKLHLRTSRSCRLLLEDVANSGEICGNILFAKKHDADGERDFSVDHALFVKSGRRVLGEKGVIFRLAQERCAPFIEFEKLREIARGVAGVNFRPIERNGILLCEGHDAIGRECAFQVEMEFGLGELAKENFDFGRGSHRDSLAGEKGGEENGCYRVTEGTEKRG